MLPAYSEIMFAGLLQAGYDPLALWLWATAGNTLGSAVNWVLGRYLLRFKERRWFPFKTENMGRAQRWFQRYGVWSLLMAWLPVGGERRMDDGYCEFHWDHASNPAHRASAYAGYSASMMVVQAMGGVMSLTGHPGGPPTRVGTSIGDITAGLFCAVGIASALYRRALTGEGGLIDVGMLDGQVAILENAIARYSATGEVPEPLGARHPSITPFDAFAAADGHVIVAAGNDVLFARLCEVLGRPDLPANPLFRSNADRTSHHAALKDELEGALRTRPVAEWLAALEAAGVPCGRPSPGRRVPRAVGSRPRRGSGEVAAGARARLNAPAPAPARRRYSNDTVARAASRASSLTRTGAVGAAPGSTVVEVSGSVRSTRRPRLSTKTRPSSRTTCSRSGVCTPHTVVPRTPIIASGARMVIGLVRPSAMVPLVARKTPWNRPNRRPRSASSNSPMVNSLSSPRVTTASSIIVISTRVASPVRMRSPTNTGAPAARRRIAPPETAVTSPLARLTVPARSCAALTGGNARAMRTKSQAVRCAMPASSAVQTAVARAHAVVCS